MQSRSQQRGGCKNILACTGFIVVFRINKIKTGLSLLVEEDMGGGLRCSALSRFGGQEGKELTMI
jgi:hypothetical protein